MRNFVIVFFSLFILIFSCDPTPQRVLKPYDPQKAGATIVESFDITGQIRIRGGPAYPSSDTLINSFYDVAEYNDCIYINNNKIIYVFEKNTFKKIKEIRLNNIYGDTVHGNGLIITIDGHAFLMTLYPLSGVRNLFFIDLNTGDATLNHYFSINGVDFLSSDVSRVGYNKADDTIWFMVFQDYKPFFLFYRYDHANDVFIFIEKKENPQDLATVSYVSTIYENICCITSYKDNYGSLENVGISIYNLENQNERLHFINVEYLNTLTLPQSAHYDGEHIWLMIERNKRLLMLKLLPDGRRRLIPCV